MDFSYKSFYSLDGYFDYYHHYHAHLQHITFLFEVCVRNNWCKDLKLPQWLKVTEIFVGNQLHQFGTAVVRLVLQEDFIEVICYDC